VLHICLKDKIIPDMAMPYETMSAEARAQQRQDRLRRREVWPKSEQEKRFYYDIGTQTATAWEAFEVVLHIALVQK